MTRTYKPWTYGDITFIKDNADKLTDKEISKILNRSISSVRKERQRLGIKKKSGRGRCEVIRPTRAGASLQPATLTVEESKIINEALVSKTAKPKFQTRILPEIKTN